MRCLLIVFAILMILGTDFAMAQNYAVAINGSKPFESEVTLYEGRITFDIYLEDAPGQAHSGGAWVDFRGFTDKISYVSAGRALTDGSAGVTGPWDPAAGLVINEPNGVGTLMIVVGQLDGDGASPDGDGDIIVARVTLESTALCDDTNISLSTIPEFATWGPVPPYDDSVITAATPNPTLVIHQCAVYDSDEDGIANANDNCPNNYNPAQEDQYPPQGNGIGDACDCECDFDCSGSVDANDVTNFLADFGRNEYNDRCSRWEPCNGDTDCDNDVDADDATKFLEDFGRNQHNNPCPACEEGDWCVGGNVCQTNDDCSFFYTFCDKPTGQCDGEGICIPPPLRCPYLDDPVCGCDGNTWVNDCIAAWYGQSIDYWGECVE